GLGEEFLWSPRPALPSLCGASSPLSFLSWNNGCPSPPSSRLVREAVRLSGASFPSWGLCR
ncbi:hypothetical protein A2U01_0116389, partial [Trifolium medium]|nr:hypothetical protein [Trifolium medium]